MRHSGDFLDTLADGDFYLQAIAVDKKLRGEGIGSTGNRLNRRSGSLPPGRSGSLLDVAANNKSARRLYERRGMTVESGWPRLLFLPQLLVRNDEVIMNLDGYRAEPVAARNAAKSVMGSEPELPGLAGWARTARCPGAEGPTGVTLNSGTYVLLQQGAVCVCRCMQTVWSLLATPDEGHNLMSRKRIVSAKTAAVVILGVIGYALWWRATHYVVERPEYSDQRCERRTGAFRRPVA